jgi:hypothetical protein
MNGESPTVKSPSLLLMCAPTLHQPMNSYNGYTPSERQRKQNAANREFPNRSHPLYKGPCQMCGNPGCPVEPHSEDYSMPYEWKNPADYAVCKTCHGRLHKRFNSPHSWTAYKVHIKRGGYGADLKDPKIAREVKALALAIEQGREQPVLPALRPFVQTDLWWDRLTVDPASLTEAWARPRRA